MKFTLSKNIKAVAFLFAFLAISFGSVIAQPNLRVLAWQGSATPLVESPYQYTTRVRNIGNQNADGVTVVVDFPLTNTSPNKFILGKLTSIPTNCQVVANKLNCNLGTIAPGDTVSKSFNFEFQVSTTNPTLTATAATTTIGEINPSNNLASISPTRKYVNNRLNFTTPFASVLVTSCTGTALTSFYECEVSPGSTQSFVMNLNLGGTISIPSYSGYTGNWDQSTLPLYRALHFTIGDGQTVDAEFNGFAVSTTCFEGITTFPNSNGNYVSAYKVCEQ